MNSEDDYIGIIDYGMGNLFSVQHICNRIGLNIKVTSNATEITNAKGIILPGVGAFGNAMQNLKELNLTKIIPSYIDTGKPFMGICLGMQLLLSESEEFGSHNGLNIIPGKVIKFRKENGSIRVPQIGWNSISVIEENRWQNSPLNKCRNNEYMYFIHSYYTLPDDNTVSLCKTTYNGIEYVSGIKKDNVFAVQFHPEKSGGQGIEIYKQWALQNNLI